MIDQSPATYFTSISEFEAAINQIMQPQNFPDCGIPLWDAAFVMVEKQSGTPFDLAALVTLRSPVPVMDRGFGSYLHAVRHMIAVGLELSGMEAIGAAECLSTSIHITHWRAFFKPFPPSPMGG